MSSTLSSRAGKSWPLATTQASRRANRQAAPARRTTRPRLSRTRPNRGCCRRCGWRRWLEMAPAASRWGWRSRASSRCGPPSCGSAGYTQLAESTVRGRVEQAVACDDVGRFLTAIGGHRVREALLDRRFACTAPRSVRSRSSPAARCLAVHPADGEETRWRGVACLAVLRDPGRRFVVQGGEPGSVRLGGRVEGRGSGAPQRSCAVLVST